MGSVAVPRVLPGDSALLPIDGPFWLSISLLGCPLNPESIVAAGADILIFDESYCK